MYTVNKKVIVGVVLLALLISIPFTVSQLSKQQQQQSHAASSGSTKLYFTPTSSAANPIQSSVGDPINLNIYVDPGNDEVTFVKYQVIFDPTKIQIDSASPAEINTANTNLVNVEGPVITANSVAQAINIGADPTHIITSKTKIVTLHFKAVGVTDGSPTSLTFGDKSQVLSASPSNQASQNVLSSTTPAFITINEPGTPTPTEPSGAPSPTKIPIPTITGTALNFTLLLHGVGSAGDNPNPTGNSLSNKNPLHQERNLDVQVLNSNNVVVASVSAPIVYDQASGTFMGGVGLPESIPSGSYSVKVKTDRYLRRLIPRIQQIISGQGTQVEKTDMIAGDTNGDNILNVLDYNALLDCGYGQLNPLPMDDPNSAFNSENCQIHTPAENVDLNDDGIINSTDYNLFLRELSVQNGD